jgi:CBS-domain-containing membrane protein
VTTGSFLERLMIVNVFLVLFNLLPAFPMDGGRILRSLMAMRMEYARATQIAANIGQGMAFVFGFLGFFGNPFLIFIALFVWIGAGQEANMAKMRNVFDGIPVSSAALSDYYVLHPEDRLARGVELIIAGSQQDFPVVKDERVVGILERKNLMHALAEHGQDYPVEKVMNTEFENADASEMLQTAMSRLQACKCHIMPVLKEGKLKGLLTMENVGEFMMIHSALQKARV